jgi:transcriptional antiterminator RfaH
VLGDASVAVVALRATMQSSRVCAVRECNRPRARSSEFSALRIAFAMTSRVARFLIDRMLSARDSIRGESQGWSGGRVPETELISENPRSPVAWYVVQSKAHHEAIVEAKLSELGLRVFLPRIVATVRAGLRRQTRVMPMFPTYVFVETNLEQCAREIRYTVGVRDFVRLSGSPEPVAAEIVELIRTRIGPSGIFEPAPRRFTPGERLRIQDGPLRDLEVIFERELSASGRVAVLLSHLELAARVVIDRSQLSAA